MANGMLATSPIDGTDGSATRSDPLVNALKYIARSYGNFVTDSVVQAGLPVTDDPMSMKLVARAAGNCGLKALPLRKTLAEIPEVALPAVLVFNDSRIWILVALDKQRNVARIVDPANPEQIVEEPIPAISAAYSDYAIFFKPVADADGSSIRNTDAGGHWFWSIIGAYWHDYVHVGMAALLINLLALASPLFTMNVYDRVVPNAAIPTLWAMAIGVVLTLVFDFFLKFARNQIINVAGKQADLALASKIFSHALAIDLEKRPPSSGQFANHIKEFETVREFITSSSLVSLIDTCFIVIFVIALYMIVGVIALVPLLAIPIIIGINLLVQAPLAGSIERSHRESAVRHSVLVESISNLDTIRALNAEGGMQTKWERSVAASGAAILSGRFWAILAQTLTGLVQALVSIVIIVWGVYLIAEGLVTMGGLIAAMMLSGRVMAPLASVAGTLTRLRQTMHSFAMLDTVMRTETERKPGKVYINRNVSSGAVEFKNVDFRYPDAADDSLKDVSFKVKPGETIGIVGRVGAGKTTIGRLVSGLYYPANGAVLVDGVDTRQFDPADLRTGVGFVSQDNVLFSGSVRENIAIGNPHAPDADTIEAARIAGVEEFVSENPMGYDMPVGEGGRLLSGGQKQAVSLARMLLRRPKILFLDEPSSNLDLASERKLIGRLKEYNNSGTTIIISTHRMSLVELTDRLITLDHGKLALDGPRDQVLRRLQQLGSVKANEREGSSL
jgi:ATP-binding cassette, subfamily C, bacterial LapB